MEERIVNFKIAKIAKSNGFQEYCTHLYDEKGVLGINFHSESRTYKNSREDTWNTAAPTQSLLQKWLREVHNIDISVTPNVNVHVEYYYFATIITLAPNKLSLLEENLEPSYFSYEEALEAGLWKALKSI